jgi:hypothetical protein
MQIGQWPTSYFNHKRKVQLIMLVNNSDFYVLLHLTAKNAVIEIISLVGDFRGQYVGEAALSDDRLVINYQLEGSFMWPFPS